MKKITFFATLLLLCFGSNVYSQSNPSKPELQAESTSTDVAQRCHTMENFEARLQNDSEYRESHKQYMRNFVAPAINFAQKIPCNGTNTINVPVAFHFDNSFSCANAACILSEINDALTTLNNDFGDNSSSPNAANCPAAYPDISTGTCITFYLAAPPACSGLDVSCDGAITVGQFQGGYNAGSNGAGNCWDDYLNIFVQSPQSGNLGVADQIPGYLNAAGAGEGVSLGAPYFGGAGGACSPLDTDNQFGLGKTLAHEIGHYLGLPHIWGDVNGGGCGGDDGFADTPNQASQYFGCPGGCVASGCGGSQQTANIMNYTNDACMDLFTEDQAATMNFYANQFFGGLNIPAANPTELYTACTGNTCNVVCPASVNTQYAGSVDVCAGLGSYTLPSAYDAATATTNTALVLDVAQSATYEWSTGNFISAGGTSIGSTVTLNNPPGCAPVVETYYLNVGCSDGSAINDTDGGVFTVNVYPDATQFTAADLVTVSGENTCNEPTLTANCAGVTITPDATNPTFPATAGQNGTAGYTVSYTAPAGVPNCCSTGGGTGGEIITNGDFEAGTTGWTETEEVPSGTPNPNPFGIIGVSNSPVNGTNDAWFGGWGGTSTLTLSQNITIPPTCSEANLTFDFAMSCAGDAGITLDVVVNGVVLGTLTCTDGTTGSITAFDLIAAGSATGNVTISFVGTEDGTGTNAPDIYIDNVSVITANCSAAATCEDVVTAAYDCAATACATVDLGINFDGFPGQTSWEITDASGAVVASSGGTYGGQVGNSTLNLSPACLPDGCYDLTFNDAIGNGMCPFRAAASSQGTFITPGTLISAGSVVATFGSVVSPGLCGNFTLSDANGTTLVTGGGAFGSSTSQQFCLTGGIAPLWDGGDYGQARLQNNDNGLNVFPTLVENNLSVYYSLETVNPVQVNIVDINGQIIQQYVQDTDAASELQLNVSDLSAGIYFIQVVANDTVLVEKFVKQ